MFLGYFYRYCDQWRSKVGAGQCARISKGPPLSNSGFPTVMGLAHSIAMPLVVIITFAASSLSRAIKNGLLLQRHFTPLSVVSIEIS